MTEMQKIVLCSIVVGLFQQWSRYYGERVNNNYVWHRSTRRVYGRLHRVYIFKMIRLNMSSLGRQKEIIKLSRIRKQQYYLKYCTET